MGLKWVLSEDQNKGKTAFVSRLCLPALKEQEALFFREQYYVFLKKNKKKLHWLPSIREHFSSWRPLS